MPDNDFWIGQEQIPVDLSLLLTYHNDEDYWYAPGEYALSPTRAEKADGSL